MRIGIITFHAAFNYGSMLQAYALQTFLQKSGHEVFIINYRPRIQRLGYPKPIEFSSLYNITVSIKRLIFESSTIKPLNKKWSLFDAFLHKYLNLTDEYTRIHELEQASFNYDVLITGSDQIWNTLAFDFSEAYFGTFLGDKAVKISYGPSMGPNPEKQNVDYLRHLLKGYRAVSVREKRTKDFLEKNNICKNVSIVLDPTMLLAKEDYDSLFDKTPMVNGKYIFYYTPGSIRHEFLQEASLIGKETGLPVICDTCYASKELLNYKNVYTYPEVGPSEFLNLVYNAEIICGASFHLIVFAILFRKCFYCMNGDVDSRMNNLMKITGFENRIWSVVNREKNRLQDIYYSSEFEDMLDNYKKSSQNFLYDFLY